MMKNKKFLDVIKGFICIAIILGFISLYIMLAINSDGYKISEDALTKINHYECEISNSYDKIMHRTNDIYHELQHVGLILCEIDPEGHAILGEIISDGFGSGYIYNQDTIYEILDRNKDKIKAKDNILFAEFKYSLYRINELDSVITELADEYNEARTCLYDYLDSLDDGVIKRYQLHDVIELYEGIEYDEYIHTEIKNVVIY